MRTIILTVVCLLGLGQAQAQDTKAERIKAIRSVYAQAKEKMAKNGKQGRSPKDLCIVVNDVRDEEAEITDWTELTVFFDERQEKQSDGRTLTVKAPYMMIERWESHGHTRYHEMLLNPKDGSLLFGYRKGETDGGFVVESRYYYNDQGQCIEEKHNTENNWSDSQSEQQEANLFLRVFRILTSNEPLSSLEGRTQSSLKTAKAGRLAHIRSVYAQAKTKTSNDDKADMKRSIHITQHDQGDDWPPRTWERHLYFDTHLYFVSEHRYLMGFDSYSEYLLEPRSHDLIFSYTRSQEENEQREWRYYYDERGYCVEVKSDAEEIDYGYGDRLAAKDFVRIYQLLIPEGERGR